MSTLEAALRGGAIAILLLTVGLHARDLLTYRLSRYSALLQLCAAAFIVESAPGFEALDLRWRMPIHIVSSSGPVMFWIVTAALFNDDSARAGITRLPGSPITRRRRARTCTPASSC